MVYFYQNEIRRFFDKYIELFFREYKQNLLKYKKILRERNALLKEQNPSKKEIRIWDDFFIKYAEKVIDSRKKFVEEINLEINKYYQKIFNKKLNVKIKYDSNYKRKKFKDNLKRDLERQTTQTGPHRDKYRIIFNKKKLKVSASQGQMKSFILSFILVVVEKIMKDVSNNVFLLLDDVLAELDSKRKKAIFNIIKNFDMQCFFTVVDDKFFKKRESYYIKIKNGVIEGNNG